VSQLHHKSPTYFAIFVTPNNMVCGVTKDSNVPPLHSFPSSHVRTPKGRICSPRGAASGYGLVVELSTIIMSSVSLHKRERILLFANLSMFLFNFLLIIFGVVFAWIGICVTLYACLFLRFLSNVHYHATVSCIGPGSSQPVSPSPMHVTSFLTTF
jgi:hypothetical protein